MAGVLAKIESPTDLKTLTTDQLVTLAGEVRDEIMRVVSTNGGHLASNLGVVELTIALHRVFDFSRDVLLWDVGHQCYAHKLLTGRRDAFETLRQQDGISGFPNPSESRYDRFMTGHSGTSISMGLGIASADALAKRRRRVVAVTGDASIATGMAFEALNHAGHAGANLTVVLNDNTMAISPTVGALSGYLNRVRTAPLYEDLKHDLRKILSRVPKVGEQLEATIEHIAGAVKSGILPGGIFESLGFHYFGPVDGHDTKGLCDHLRGLAHMNGPILFHVLTRKGEGFQPAALDPTAFHSAPPFEIESGKVRAAHSTGRSFTKAFSTALVDLAERDERIVAITAAMPDGTGLSAFQERFPRRYFDVGIGEQHAVGLASGLARGGALPVVAIYSTFLQRAYDQIFHDICLQGLPCIFAVDRAGLVGGDGPTHHGVFDIAYMRHLPRMTLMAPRDGDQVAEMLATAASCGGPVAIRYARDLANAIPAEEAIPLEDGRATLLRSGTDAAVLALGPLAGQALGAATILADEGIDLAVADARFVKPLDVETASGLLERTGLLVTVEDHVLAGGFGSSVLEALEDGRGDGRIVTLGIPDRFIAHGERGRLLAEVGLDAAGIAETVRRAIAPGRRASSLRPVVLREGEDGGRRAAR